MTPTIRGVTYWNILVTRRTGEKIKSEQFKMALVHFMKYLAAITGNWSLQGPKNMQLLGLQ